MIMWQTTIKPHAYRKTIYLENNNEINHRLMRLQSSTLYSLVCGILSWQRFCPSGILSQQHFIRGHSDRWHFVRTPFKHTNIQFGCLKQEVALLSQRGRATLRVCQQLASTVQNVEQTLLLFVTQATDLSLHAVKCAVLLSLA